MVVTFLGFFVVLIGTVLLFTRSMVAMLIFVAMCSLFGGGAAVILTALGSSSLTPAHVALGFLIIRTVAPGVGTYPLILEVLERHLFLVAYSLYSFMSAFIFPRLFANQISVTAMRTGHLRSMYHTEPLHVTSQNITTAVYIIGSMLAALAAALAASRPKAVRAWVPAVCVLMWCHIGFGLLGQVVDLSIFRNGSYAQLTQSYSGYVRISGLFPEPSAFATYGFGWLVFACELWIRDVRAKWTGPAAIAMFLVLFASTSSTAYVSMALYGAILGGRMLLFPQGLPKRKAIAIFVLMWMSLVLGVAAVAMFPKLAHGITNMLADMTLRKSSSSSGQTRLFWALQGWNAFKVSHGVGIGAGSFRSSSILTSVLGSTGVIGVVLLLGHLLAVLAPWRASTYGRPASETEAVGVAAAWTVVAGSIPAFTSAPSPDPGLLFGLFSGLALTWRYGAYGAAASSRRSPSRETVRRGAPAAYQKRPS